MLNTCNNIDDGSLSQRCPNGSKKPALRGLIVNEGRFFGPLDIYDNRFGVLVLTATSSLERNLPLQSSQLRKWKARNSKDESMRATSCTCEESVPLYISVFEGRNVNLYSPTASFLSRKIAWDMPGCYNAGFPDVKFVLGVEIPFLT